MMRTLNGRSVYLEALSPINIALVKYWGKAALRDNVPLNNSLSMTLDPSVLHSRSRLELCPSFDEDSIVLNGETAPPNSRQQRIL